jgi:hypothetical protein
MNLKHAIAASMVGILLLEAAGLAQTPSTAGTLAISREQGIHVLATNIQIGSHVRIELANGDRLEGRLVDKSDDELVVLSGLQRQIVAVTDIASVRLPVRPEITNGKAFGIGAAIGGAAILGWFLMVLSNYR